MRDVQNHLSGYGMRDVHNALSGYGMRDVQNPLLGYGMRDVQNPLTVRDAGCSEPTIRVSQNNPYLLIFC